MKPKENIMKTKAKHAPAHQPSAPEKVRIKFHHEKAKSVYIAGAFNDWRPEATPMISLGNGQWVKELTLAPGRYEYRLVVEGEWICDPKAPECVPNPFGGCNSVLIVSALRTDPAPDKTT